MKKRILALIVMIITIFTIGVSASETLYTTTALRCRNQPSMSGTVIKTFPKGTKLEAIGCDGNWIQVYDGKTQGWCHITYLTKYPDDSSECNTDAYPTKDGMEYLGLYKLTGYCACSKCSGGWGGKTASGATATVGVTIAAPSYLKFGTKLYIEGVGYRTVQDRGGAIKGNKLDVFVGSHSACYAGNINKKARVYIVR